MFAFSVPCAISVSLAVRISALSLRSSSLLFLKMTLLFCHVFLALVLFAENMILLSLVHWLAWQAFLIEWPYLAISLYAAIFSAGQNSALLSVSSLRFYRPHGIIQVLIQI